MTAITSIDRDIFQHQLAGIAEEMSQALRRSSHSSIIWDIYDYACAIFVPDGELLAQAETITSQLGTMTTALRHVWQAIPLAAWKPGDVIICNDPYRGCTHTPDLTVFSPVYHRGRIIAVTSTIAHHIDIGGRFPCTTAIDNAEVFGEGLIFPPVRIEDEGKPNEIVLDFIRSNVRDPKACIGDIRAQIAGCRTAERRLDELAGRYGADLFRHLSADVMNYGERYVRGVVAGWKDGRYEAEVQIEDGIDRPEHIRIHVAVTIEGESIGVDFSGSSEQRECALNCPWSSTRSMTTYAIKCLTAPDTPLNDGFNRPITVTAPLGSVLNPRRPAAVGSRHFAQQAVADVILKALAPLVPERSAAACQISFPVFRSGGVDDRRVPPGMLPHSYRIMDIMGGGMGGSEECDGLNAVDTHGGNCALLSAEVMETLSPVRVRESRLVPGSGGAGRHRGGLAIEREYEMLASRAIVACQSQQASPETVPWGAMGGEPGAPAQSVFQSHDGAQRVLPPRSRHMPMQRGDTIRVRGAGGGGFGPPAERDPAACERDRREGYV